jgi:hypothetical protein
MLFLVRLFQYFGMVLILRFFHDWKRFTVWLLFPYYGCIFENDMWLTDWYDIDDLIREMFIYFFALYIYFCIVTKWERKGLLQFGV